MMKIVEIKKDEQGHYQVSFIDMFRRGLGEVVYLTTKSHTEAILFFERLQKETGLPGISWLRV